MLKYLLFIILGILIFILLNRKDGFSIGAKITSHYSTQYESTYYFNSVTNISTWENPDTNMRTSIYPGEDDVEPLPEGPLPGLSLGPPGHLVGEFSIEGRVHGGMSSHYVWKGTYNGNNIFIKTMGRIQLLISQNLSEFSGVVQLIGIAPYSLVSILYRITDEERTRAKVEDLTRNNIKLVVMEKLEPIRGQFSGDGEEFVADNPLDIRFTFGRDYEIELVCSEVNKESFRQLLTTIIDINSRGYLWGDLKKQNIGIDKSGHIKIFDFDIATPPEYWVESRAAREGRAPYIWSDLLAFGKFYFNELVSTFVFQPGRDYTHERFTLSYQDYQNILSKLTGPPDLVRDSRRVLELCFSLDSNSTDENIDNVQTEFLKLFSVDACAVDSSR